MRFDSVACPVLLFARSLLFSVIAFAAVDTDPTKQPRSPSPPPARRDPNPTGYLESISPLHFNPQLFDEYHRLPPYVARRLNRFIGRQDFTHDPFLRVQLNDLSHGNLPGIEEALGRDRMRTAHATALDLEQRQKRALGAAIRPLAWDPSVPAAHRAAVDAQARAFLAQMSVPDLLHWTGPQGREPPRSAEVEWDAHAVLTNAARIAAHALAFDEVAMSRLDPAVGRNSWDWIANPQWDQESVVPVRVWNRWLRQRWHGLPPADRTQIEWEAEKFGERVKWDTAHGVPHWAPYDESSVIRRHYARPRPRRESSPASSTDSGPARRRKADSYHRFSNFQRDDPDDPSSPPYYRLH